jgi:hypothetical protein
VVFRLFEFQRIEIGSQMAAHAVGADHHDGAYRIARGLLHLFFGNLDARGLGILLQLVADDLGGSLFIDAPIAVERGDQFAIAGDRPVGPLPGSAACIIGHISGLIAQFGEKGGPFGPNLEGSF